MDLDRNLPAFVRSTTVFIPDYKRDIRNDNRWFSGLLRLMILVSFIFMLVPAVDITVSGWFADAAGKFSQHDNRFLLALRDLHRMLPAFIAPALLFGVVIQALFNRRWLPAPHRLLYILSVYAIGAAIIVHTLKYVIGRARPSEISEFGGNLLFSPAWQISHACQSSCSFPSGEAASAMAMLAIPLILGGVYRLPLMMLAGIFALIFSLNRIVMGAHFLSDVTLSWLFVVIVIAWLWPVFQRNALRIDQSVLRIGKHIRKNLHRAFSKTKR